MDHFVIERFTEPHTFTVGIEGTFGGPDGRHCYVTVSDLGNIQSFLADSPGRCWGMWRESR